MSASTVSKTLTTVYQLIGAGPGLISLELKSRAEIHFTTGAAPTAGSAYHSISRGMTAEDRSWTEVPTGMTAYARVRANDAETKLSFTQS